MPRNSQMSRMLHVLIHMDRHVKRSTSEAISKMLGTNPVVVRRMMAGLRDKGLVTSEKGHGGGWELTGGLDTITLLDIYEAVGAPELFNIGPHAGKADCLVEQAVDERMEMTLNEAKALLTKRFREITVEDIAGEFELRLKAQLPRQGVGSECTKMT